MIVNRSIKYQTAVRVSVCMEQVTDDKLYQRILINKEGRLIVSDFKDSELYKFWIKERTTQHKKLIKSKGLKIVEWRSYIDVGYNQDDFIHNMVSVVQKGYAVRVPRFVKHFLLYKHSLHANNVRIMRR